MMKKKLLSIAMCLCAALSLYGCSKSASPFTFDIDSNPQNLDPQYATTASSRTILCNVFEGLMKLDDTGSPAVAAATDYTVNDAGTEYIFHLNQKAVWSNGEPVTAADFRFAFLRLFTRGAVSPNAASFSCIKNAGAILQGAMSSDSLGVTAVDDYTLKIQLEYENPYFTELLCSPAALPCNQKFFETTKAKYGLSPSTLIYNGPYALSAWNDKQLELIHNSSYLNSKGTDNGISKVILHILAEGENRISRFTSKQADAALLDATQVKEIKNRGYNVSGSSNTVWMLVYNTKGIFGNTQLRSSLSSCIDLTTLSIAADSGLSPAQGFVTPSVTLGQTPYRQLTGTILKTFDPQGARSLMSAALAELKISKLPSITLLAPDFGSSVNVSSIIQGWQKELSTYINVSIMQETDILNAVRSGSFDVALVPYGADYNSPKSILSNFGSGTAQNYSGYSNGAYDGLLSAADASRSTTQLVDTYRSMENTLVSDCPASPLFYETKYLAYSGKVTGLYASASFDRIYFDKIKK